MGTMTYDKILTEAAAKAGVSSGQARAVMNEMWANLGMRPQKCANCPVVGEPGFRAGV